MAMTQPLYLPAMQGQIGSWLYYACLVRLSDVAERISYAREIHQNTSLSDMIQRRLDESKRGRDIAQYLLHTKDRFFNSLVVGVYGGDPQWHPFDVTTRKREHADAPMENMDVVGYLELSGGEHLFALDGQHRLAGIKQALEKDASLGDERVSVLFVAHQKSAAGLKRTRSLFVAINKRAVPVQKRDIIALDEVDLAAIITRQLVDDHRWFSRGQVDVASFTARIPVGAPALTTIGSFYDVINRSIHEVMAVQDKEQLQEAKRIRLSDSRIAHYRSLALSYFDTIAGLDPDLKAALTARNPGPLFPAGRTAGNPRLLFRPIGFTIVTAALSRLRKKHTLTETLKLAKSIPLLMTSAPFVDIIYDPKRNRMATTNAGLASRLLVYMLGGEADAKLKDAYAKERGIPANRVRLPNRLV
jgi:DNA sulfur modification protein DndB